ncbi:F-box domain-containing protein [Mycena sanguinolenta]|uniref:F-box domain-containing protein n=1 Tax=Mycena sanguinolenta TaxID=230812 RepID=A0A8H6Z8S1_9AGAR|nr:F-box domain-containing protein [Mycena sanguinolenta]
MPSACSRCGAFIFPEADGKIGLQLAPHTRALVSRLSNTNEPPLDEDISVIRPIIEETRAHLATVDAEIARLRYRLRELEEERAILLPSHTRTMGILSPLRRLPPEILGGIFSQTLRPISDIFSIKNCPWVLTHVCSNWRAVALADPSLWSLIVVDFGVKRRYPLKMIGIQIERARSLEIHFDGSESRSSRPQIALFDLLAKHAARWEDLSIKLTSHLVPRVMNLNLTRLCRVWVQWDTAESQNSSYNSVDFLRTAISLVDINVLCEYRFLPTHLPLHHHLMRYNLDAPWDTHVELLKSLPNLQEVRLCLDFDQGEWENPGEPITLPHLRRLYVSDPTCLRYLRAPGLEEIAIQSGDAGESPETFRSLEHFLRQSSCAPRSLRILGLLDASLGAILRKCPSFAEVAVADSYDDSEDTRREILSSFLTLFTTPTSVPSSIPFPNITAIRFGSHKPDATLFALFFDMLESRCNVAECAMKTAELMFPDSPVHPDPASISRIESLREAGLHVSLWSGETADRRVDRWFHCAEWI